MNKNNPWITILLHIQRRFIWLTDYFQEKQKTHKRTQSPVYINRTDKRPRSTEEPPKIPSVPVRYRKRKKAAIGSRRSTKRITPKRSTKSPFK